MFNLLSLIAFLGLSLYSSPTYSASPGQYPVIINGRVLTPGGQAIAGATIVAKELNVSTTSHTDGYFSLRKLPQGSYTLLVSHIGYNKWSRIIEVDAEAAFINIVLYPTYIELQEVVVQHQGSSFHKRELSLSVATANQEYLNRTPGMTLMQSLQRMPGVQAMNIGTGISKPVIRGMSFNRVVVAENNIKQQGQQWGEDHGLEIDPYGVERVEIIKGPASLIFGSDAIGGAINIRPAAIPQQNTLQAQALFTARSNNDLLGTSLMTALNKNGKFFRVRATIQSYADFRVPARNYTYNNWIIPLPGQRLSNTSGSDRSAAVTAGFRRKWGVSSVTVSHYNQHAGFFAGAHGLPDPQGLSNQGSERQTSYPMQKVDHLKILSNSNISVGRNWLEIDLGFQQNHRRELNTPHVHGSGPLPDTDVELELLLNTLSSNIKFHHNINPGNTWIYGMNANISRNETGGYSFLIPEYSAADAGVFVISNITIGDSLYINAGGRADISGVNIIEHKEAVWADPDNISHYNVRSPDFSNTWVNSTLTAGISWFPAPAWNVKVNLGSGYRTPTAVELSANGIHHGSFRHELGDTTLRPERTYQLDLALMLNQKDIYLSLSPFINYFSNYLFLNPTGLFSELPGAGQIYRFEQAKALHLGAEAYFDWHMSANLHTSAGTEVLWAQNLDNNLPLPFIPPHALVFEASYKLTPRGKTFGETRITAAIRTTASQGRVARNELTTDGYALVNLGVGTIIRIAGIRAETDLRIQNLFDTFYKDHLSFYRRLELPEPGRNFNITIRIPFNRENWFDINDQ